MKKKYLYVFYILCLDNDVFFLIKHGWVWKLGLLRLSLDFFPWKSHSHPPVLTTYKTCHRLPRPFPPIPLIVHCPNFRLYFTINLASPLAHCIPWHSFRSLNCNLFNHSFFWPVSILNSSLINTNLCLFSSFNLLPLTYLLNTFLLLLYLPL
jgi:hypothetical protein